MPQGSDALFSSYFPILSQRRIRRGMRNALLDQYRLPTLSDLLAQPQPRGFAEQQLNTILNAQARLASVGQQPAPPEQDTSLLQDLTRLLNIDREILFGALARAFPGLEQERWFQAWREGSGELLEQEFGVTNPIARFVLGTALDVLTSPLSYLSFGLAGLGREAAEQAARRLVVGVQFPFVTAPRQVASFNVEGIVRRAEQATASITDALRPYFSRGGASALLPQTTRQAIQQAQEEVFRTERFIRGISRKEITEALKPLEKFRVREMEYDHKRLAFLLGEMDPDAIRQVTQIKQENPELAERIAGLARYMRGLMDELYEVEQKAGLNYRRVENYLPHLFEDDEDTVRGFLRAIQENLASRVRAQTTERGFFRLPREHQVFRLAEEAKLRPIYEPERVIAIRIWQSVKSRANHDLVNRLKNMAKEQPDETAVVLRMPTSGARQAPPRDWIRADTLIPELVDEKAVYYIHPELARSVINLNNAITNRQEISDLLRTIDLAHGLFKGIVTGTPGKVLRDFVGNTFNAIVAGVPPMRFLYHFASALRSWAPEMLEKEAVKVGKTSYTWRQLHQILHENNLVSSGEVEEITGLLRRVGERTNSLLERGTQAIRSGRYSPFRPIHNMAAAVDTNSKLALLREFMQRGMSPEEAAARVRRYLFDYSDLTPTEKKFLRNLFPFYTFWRKEIPVLLEGVLSHPELFKAAGYLHEESKSAFELSDDEVPDWIRQNLGLVFRIGDRLFGGVPGLPLDPLASVESPTEGIGDVLESGARYVLSQMTPLVRVPAELAGNVQFYSGAPIQAREGQTIPLGIGQAQMQLDPRFAYLMQQIFPVVGRTMMRVLQPDVEEISELPARPEQSALEQLIRGLSGMSSFASPFNPERELAINAMLYARLLQDQITNLRRQGIYVPTTDELGLEERPRLGEERALEALTALLQLSRG